MISDNSTHVVPIPYLIEAVLFLLGVVITAPLCKRLNISPILGYLAIGAAVGPHALGLVQDSENIRHFAELGVVFLLFSIGLELSFERLKAFANLIFGLGSLQVVSCAVAIAAIAGLWGNPIEACVVIGLSLALSSTAMVMQLLNERGEIATAHGRSSFSVLLFQDLAVVPILILISMLGQDDGGNVWSEMALALGKAVLVIAGILVLGRFGLRRVFALASRTRSTDVFMAMSLLAILAISMATGVAGLSMALGAFLAGLLLAETEFRHQIEGEIEPFRGLFLSLFFMSVGMAIDFQLAFERGVWVLLAVLGLISLKFLFALISALLFRLPRMQAMRTSLLLASSGEFAFVLIGTATQVYPILDREVGMFMVVVAGFSMALTPFLAYLGQTLARLERTAAELPTLTLDTELHGHIVLAGFGRMGASIARALGDESLPFIALERDPDVVSEARQNFGSVHVGDVTRAEVLKTAGIERAVALVVAINEPGQALRAVDVARRLSGALTIIARAENEKHADALRQAGANTVIVETLEASLSMLQRLVKSCGYSEEASRTLRARLRNELNPSYDA